MLLWHTNRWSNWAVWLDKGFSSLEWGKWMPSIPILCPQCRERCASLFGWSGGTASTPFCWEGSGPHQVLNPEQNGKEQQLWQSQSRRSQEDQSVLHSSLLSVIYAADRCVWCWSGSSTFARCPWREAHFWVTVIPPTETGDRSLCSAVAELDTCLTGWYLTLQPYDFTVQYLAGKANLVAGCLSRVHGNWGAV